MALVQRRRGSSIVSHKREDLPPIKNTAARHPERRFFSVLGARLGTDRSFLDQVITGVGVSAVARLDHFGQRIVAGARRVARRAGEFGGMLFGGR